MLLLWFLTRPRVVDVEEHGRVAACAYIGGMIVDIGQRRARCRRCVVVVPTHYALWALDLDNGELSPMGIVTIAQFFLGIVEGGGRARGNGGKRRRAVGGGVSATSTAAGCSCRRAWRDVAVYEGLDGGGIFGVRGGDSRGRGHDAARFAVARSGAGGGRGDGGCKTWGDGSLCGAGGSEGGLQRPRGIGVVAVYGHDPAALAISGVDWVCGGEWTWPSRGAIGRLLGEGVRVYRSVVRRAEATRKNSERAKQNKRGFLWFGGRVPEFKRDQVGAKGQTVTVHAMAKR